MNSLAAPRIYLIRHATPDWSRKDIPYNIPPGPPLIQQGEIEAARVGEFLKQAGVRKLYHSPLERARRTAQIAAEIASIPFEELTDIAEIRPGETDHQYELHLLPVWDRAAEESRQKGSVGLITHGGPVRIMLQLLGLTPAQIDFYNKRFDGTNPLPPAGIWMAEKCPDEENWRLELVFVPAIWETDHEI